MSAEDVARNVKKGFTLVELMLSIALLAIAVGVTTDIILTITRSYSKTQITNEIEQNANFVFLKLSKELRNAVSVSVAGNNQSLTLVDRSGSSIMYCLDGEVLRRSVSTGGTPSCASGQLLINNDPINGVKVACDGGVCFRSLGTNPAVTQISLEFSQAGNPSGVQFTGSVRLDEAIVSRGTY